MGTFSSPDGACVVRTFTSDASWIEGAALKQLNDLAALPGMRAVAGMPDLHPGKYGPVGCAMLADQIHPAFVGADIGCGMGLYQLDLAARKIRVEQAAARLTALDGAWDGEITAARVAADVQATAFDAALGTIGGGNHFCELQVIDDIVDPMAAARANLDATRAFVLVHSGSRGLGYAVLERLLASGVPRLDPAQLDGLTYLADHDHAVAWAQLNRQLIARRAAEALLTDTCRVADLSHNLAEITSGGVLHRKGAAPADRGLVPIPGSRGTLSYLVEPLATAPADALASLAHGAGRKYDRASMHGRAGRTKSERDGLARNPFGGVVICADRDLIVEEAPAAYKAIGQVIDDLVAHGLVRVVATFRPLVTFKKASGAAIHDPRSHRAAAKDRDQTRSHQRRARNREDFR